MLIVVMDNWIMLSVVLNIIMQNFVMLYHTANRALHSSIMMPVWLDCVAVDPIILFRS
jgi:hypothetical protein